MRPASSPGDASFISTLKPRRSAQRRYMRSSISAQSWESVPPAPAFTVTTASPASKRPEKSRSSSSSASRRSTESSCPVSSAAISSSSTASSASSARSSTSWLRRAEALEPALGPRVLRRDLGGLAPGRPRTRAVASPPPADRSPHSAPSGSKVIREQLQLPRISARRAEIPSFGSVSAISLRVSPYRVFRTVLYRVAADGRPMENGSSKRKRQPVSWLLRKLAHGLPPLPTIGGRALATRVAGLLLVGGAILIGVTVALPPAAEGSDLLILGYGAVAAVCGVLLLNRRRVSEPALGPGGSPGHRADHPRHARGRPHDGHRGQRGPLPLGLAVRLLVLRPAPRTAPARPDRRGRRNPADRPASRPSRTASPAGSSSSRRCWSPGC